MNKENARTWIKNKKIFIYVRVLDFEFQNFKLVI